MAQFKKRTMDLNRGFSKEEIKMAKKTSKNVCHLLLLGKCKSNNFEISSYPSQNGKDQQNKCWRGYSERGTFIYCWWDCKMNSNSRDQCGEFWIKVKRNLPFLAYAQRILHPTPQILTCSAMLTVTLFIIATKLKQPKY